MRFVQHLRLYRVLASLLLGFALTLIPTGCGVVAHTATGGGSPTTGTSTVTLSASPASISAGSTAMLTITATNATSVTLTGSDGASYVLAASGGTQAVSPATTTTYTATATSSGGSTKAVATVTVTTPTQVAPQVSVSASPGSIVSGNTAVLTVTASNATAVTLTGTDGTSYVLAPAGGSETVSPSATTTYTAVATGAVAGKATATATVTVTQPAAQITMAASPATIHAGAASTLTVAASHATAVTITGSDSSSYSLAATGGTVAVTPHSTTTYTAQATGPGAGATATATISVLGAADVSAINHVILMMQENHTFDNYFGMLNPYRHTHGWNLGDDGMNYDVDGIEDKLSSLFNTSDTGTVYHPFKLTSSCVDDESSDWLASYGDVNTYDFLASREILDDGFVHNAAGFANSCNQSGTCSGTFTDTDGERAMGYYDQDFLNYYYYMASQFAVSDRWFSPISSKSVDNRIATFSGGTTQGLVKDPGNDGLAQLNIPTIFEELDRAGVSWKIYYTVTEGYCLDEDDCSSTASARYPATFFSEFASSYQYIYENTSGAACTGTTKPSSVVGDSTNSFCVDPNHIEPLAYLYSDMKNGTLPSFTFIEPGYGNNDEHPGSGQSILAGQAQVSNIVNTLMNSISWKDSVFFLTYDEGGGPYDHVPPVPGHSNDRTDGALGAIPDISSISVNADGFWPCVPTSGIPTTQCDLAIGDPGANPNDAPALAGFAAQLGFRVPNMVVSPFTRKHYVSHVPMDHTAVIRFVENRFIAPSTYLTFRDAAQPDLLDFFDFNNTPWQTPPTPPIPASDESLGQSTCHPGTLSQ